MWPNMTTELLAEIANKSVLKGRACPFCGKNKLVAIDYKDDLRFVKSLSFVKIGLPDSLDCKATGKGILIHFACYTVG